MMQPDGSFTFWPYGRRIHYWTSIYASHFLIEAGKEGYQVSKDIHNKIVDNLKDIARGKKMKDTDVIERIYAAYVLAKDGRLEKRITNYLKDLDTDKLPAFSRFQLAGVLAQAGDEESALALLPAEIQWVVQLRRTYKRDHAGCSNRNPSQQPLRRRPGEISD